MRPLPPPSSELTFDPTSVAEVLRLYRENKKDGAYYLMASDGDYLALTWRDVLKLKRHLIRTKPGEGEIASEADLLQAHVIEYRRVDYVLSGLAGHRPGLYDFQGTKMLVTKAPPRIIEPAPGASPFIQRFLMSLLPTGTDGIVQWVLFCMWLKRGIEDVRAGRQRQSQILILAGAKGDGKNRLQENIITPCLAGRSADPIASLTGESQFNAECFGAEHLLSSDPASSVEKKDRLQFKQRLKQTSVGDWQRYHEKGKTPVFLPPVWRMSLSINTGPDDLALLPAPTSDFADKVIMLKTSKAEGLPGPEMEEQAEFRAKIDAELPAFIHFLLHDLDTAVPEEYRSRRFGVRSYENPDIRSHLDSARPEIQLLEMLDTLKPWLKSDKDHWLGKWSELQTLLEKDNDTSTNFERWTRFNNLVQNLSKLKEESESEGHLHGRVLHWRHNTDGGFWKIYPPENGATSNPCSL